MEESCKIYNNIDRLFYQLKVRLTDDQLHFVHSRPWSSMPFPNPPAFPVSAGLRPTARSFWTFVCRRPKAVRITSRKFIFRWTVTHRLKSRDWLIISPIQRQEGPCWYEKLGMNINLDTKIYIQVWRHDDVIESQIIISFNFIFQISKISFKKSF